MSARLRWILPLAVIAILALTFGAAAETRTGSWIDDFIFVEQPSDAAGISQLEAGEIDLFSVTIGKADLFDRVRSNPDLGFERSYGSFGEFTFNPYGPTFQDGRLNPFHNPRIREALNWLIDRDYLAEEIWGGMVVPRYTTLNTIFPDYARLADITRLIEIQYAYDPVKAEAVISEEMQAMGATLVNGKWHYNGEPVVLIGVIRLEDQRLETGDYLANVLESVGFTVDRQYKNAAEASPLWINGDPELGLFHYYTGGWISTAISRDLGDNFTYYYTPDGLASPLWQAYSPDPEFSQIARRLTNNDFKTMEERRDLFARGLQLSMADSVRIFTYDQTAFIPRLADVKVTADLSGAISGTYLWPRTIRKEGQVGGTLRIALFSMLPEPWNALDGTNWIYDQMLIRGTSDQAVIANPFTGLALPNRIEKADVYIQEGLPVGQTLDWVNLEFVPEIEVPADAWIDWDASTQTFITVGEKHPEGLTALRKSVVYYPEDLEELTWHDGSNISPADFVMGMILSFDRAKPESAIHDQSQEGVLATFLAAFRGVRIVSTKPLVIETYSDNFALDAENSVSTWWPQYAQGPGSWHTLGLGILAEAAGELAFSKSKADTLNVEWANYIAGPSLAILNKHLSDAQANGYIPYAPTLSQFVSADEAAARWSNYADWYAEKGHFWVGSGPLYLERAYPIERQAHLKRYEAYPDSVEKWDRFAEPNIAEVDVFGPGRVTIGSEAIFEVEVTFDNEPYRLQDIDAVSYLLFDASGEMVGTGSAEGIEDGLFEITLSSDVTSKLSPGSNQLEVVVAPIIVSIPSSASLQFVAVR